MRSTSIPVLMFAASALTGLACSSAPPNATREGDQLTIADLVRNAKPSIVRIVTRSSSGAGVGTGFVIDESGNIATNLHVIAGADDIEVQLLDGTSLPLERVLAFDVERDLVVLHVDVGRKLPSLTLADSDRVAAGDPVVAIGNPLGVLDYTVSDGLISSVRKVSPSITVLQISAPISQGSSGGPLFNPQGQVIGVVRAFIAQGQNLNFGIPSNYLRTLMSRDEKLSLAQLNETLLAQMAAAAAKSKNGKSGGVVRDVPVHDVAILAGCSEDSLHETVQVIQEAIQVGAPLYNAGDPKACFLIYQGAGIRLERESDCKGVRDALGQGLLRASTKEGPALKAWAMRDAFDGLLHVIRRKQADN